MSDTPDPVVARNPSEAVASFDHHSRGTLDRLQHFLHRYPTMVPVIVLVLSVAAFGLISPNFFSAFNLSLILQQVAVVGTLAAAQSLVILTAGIDLGDRITEHVDLLSSWASCRWISASRCRFPSLSGWPAGQQQAR